MNVYCSTLITRSPNFWLFRHSSCQSSSRRRSGQRMRVDFPRQASSARSVVPSLHLCTFLFRGLDIERWENNSCCLYDLLYAPPAGSRCAIGRERTPEDRFVAIIMAGSVCSVHARGSLLHRRDRVITRHRGLYVISTMAAVSAPEEPYASRSD